MRENKKTSQIFRVLVNFKSLSLFQNFFSLVRIKISNKRDQQKGAKKQGVEKQIDVQSLTFHIDLIHNQTGERRTHTKKRMPDRGCLYFPRGNFLNMTISLSLSFSLSLSHTHTWNGEWERVFVSVCDCKRTCLKILQRARKWEREREGGFCTFERESWTCECVCMCKLFPPPLPFVCAMLFQRFPHLRVAFYARVT